MNVSIEKVNYWCSEEYRKRMDAIGALNDTADKIVDDYVNLWDVIKALIDKLTMYDDTVQELMAIHDDFSDHIDELNDWVRDMLKAVA